MRERTYRMTDLMAITGLSQVQIRTYIRKFSLPGAIRAGEYSCYRQSTLDGLRIAQECYEANMFSRDIRDRIAYLTNPDDADDDAA